MKNLEIAKIFEQMADVLALLDENTFRILAYRKIARSLEEWPEAVEKLAEMEGGKALENVPGIGKSSAERIKEYLRTGRIGEFEELLAQVPAGVLQMIKIPSLGPKTAALLWREGGVTTIEDLKQKIEKGETGGLLGIKGLGEKKLKKIAENLAHLETSSGRIRLGEALPIAEQFVEFLRTLKGVENAQYCGSLRRGKETIGDIDIAVAAKLDLGLAIGEAVCKHPFCASVIQLGESKTSIRTGNGVQVDVRVVPPESFRAALQYFTGSKEHNVRLRELAVKKGYKLNEWGLFKNSGKDEKGPKGRDTAGERVVGATEEEIYAALGMATMPPEMREDRGEIDAAIAAFQSGGEASTAKTDLKRIEAAMNKSILSQDGKIALMERYFFEDLSKVKVYYTESEGLRISDAALKAIEALLMLSFPDPEPRLGTKELPSEWERALPRFNKRRPDKSLGAGPGDVRNKAQEILKSVGAWDLFLQCLAELNSDIGWFDCSTSQSRSDVCNRLEAKQGVYAFKGRSGSVAKGYIGLAGPFAPKSKSTANVKDRVHEHFTDKYASRNEPVIDNFPKAFLREELHRLRSQARASSTSGEKAIQLVEVTHIRGDLHMHTTASDGSNSIEELIAEAKRRGYQYIAITDHSKSQFQANGLKADRLLEHIEKIHAAAKQAEKSGILVLAGSEVDILADGSLDYEDDLLAKLDWVVASPHAALSQEHDPATQRLVRAASNPYVCVMGHPTGRIVPSRRGLAPDMSKVIFAASRNGVAMEINANYHRLDLRDVHVKMAVDAKVPICINTDSHSLPEFDQMRYGILTARRGWARPSDVLNAKPLEEFKKWLANRKQMTGW